MSIFTYFMRRRRRPLIVLEENALADNHAISFVQMKDMPENDGYYPVSALLV